MPQEQELPMVEVEKPRNKRTRALIVDGKIEIRWGRSSGGKGFREKFRKEVEVWANKKLASPNFSLEKTKILPKPEARDLGGQFRVYMDPRARQSLRTLRMVSKVLDTVAAKFKVSYGRLNESRARSYQGLSYKKNNISLRLYHPATLEPIPYPDILRTAIHELAHNHPKAKGHGKAWKNMEHEMLEFASKEGLLKNTEDWDEEEPVGKQEVKEMTLGRELDTLLASLPKNEGELLKHETQRLLRYGPRPNLTVDGIVVNGKNEILLIKRKNPPFQSSYALPGGFVDYEEAVEDAVVRELKEETNLNCAVDSLVGVYSRPNRDPRGHTVSVVFAMKVLSGKARSGDDAAEVRWFPLDQKLPELAFDHTQIVRDFRGEVTKHHDPRNNDATIQTTLRKLYNG